MVETARRFPIFLGLAGQEPGRAQLGPERQRIHHASLRSWPAPTGCAHSTENVVASSIESVLSPSRVRGALTFVFTMSHFERAKVESSDGCNRSFEAPGSPPRHYSSAIGPGLRSAKFPLFSHLFGGFEQPGP